MITSYLIIIAEHRLPDTTYIFLVFISSKYLLGYMHMFKHKSLKQITFSHTYTYIEKVKKVNV